MTRLVGRASSAVRTWLAARGGLVLEIIALRHQIVVLDRGRTRRPCLCPLDRMLWILLSRWWPKWRESLVIVQAETVLRWRRQGLRLIWRYGHSGRWRGGRPRIANELRGLIDRMSRENTLWGAPRIHGELLKLGFPVSQATVSRYLPRRDGRPSQSWRTFIKNQTVGISFAHSIEDQDGRRDVALGRPTFDDDGGGPVARAPRPVVAGDGLPFHGFLQPAKAASHDRLGRSLRNFRREPLSGIELSRPSVGQDLQGTAIPIRAPPHRFTTALRRAPHHADASPRSPWIHRRAPRSFGPLNATPSAQLGTAAS